MNTMAEYIVDLNSQQLTMLMHVLETEDEPECYSFFEFLKIDVPLAPLYLISDISSKNQDGIHSIEYYDIITFRIFICELFYNAVRMFPEVSEYTITCKTKKVTTKMIFSTKFENLVDDQRQRAMVVIHRYVNGDPEPESFVLNKNHLFYLYVANRCHELKIDIINGLIMLMYGMDDPRPEVTTECKINHEYFKKQLKIK